MLSFLEAVSYTHLIRSVWSWETNERMMPRMVMARIERTNLVNLVAMVGGIFITGSFLCL